jgi:hypothetical protein
MSTAEFQSGSARVSRVGDGVAPSRSSVEQSQAEGARYSRRRLQDDEARNECSFRRDAETSTRDACATQGRLK